jgi:hypothetical protein
MKDEAAFIYDSYIQVGSSEEVNVSHRTRYSHLAFVLHVNMYIHIYVYVYIHIINQGAADSLIKYSGKLSTYVYVCIYIRTALEMHLNS